MRQCLSTGSRDNLKTKKFLKTRRCSKYRTFIVGITRLCQSECHGCSLETAPKQLFLHFIVNSMEASTHSTNTLDGSVLRALHHSVPFTSRTASTDSASVLKSISVATATVLLTECSTVVQGFKLYLFAINMTSFALSFVWIECLLHGAQTTHPVRADHVVAARSLPDHAAHAVAAVHEEPAPTLQGVHARAAARHPCVAQPSQETPELHQRLVPRGGLHRLLVEAQAGQTRQGRRDKKKIVHM